ncbi:ecdysteroid 22-kinase [Danaus plexippus plexippus]|uniref:Ecdysteroid 22-kinase n=1 Tax=Danaus plexippus plexippus TaxID=278856 RepID=A0A212EPG7_DANPL|nr:ecdysteroid 22-kinase [Danaus plexippus plexippus]
MANCKDILCDCLKRVAKEQKYENCSITTKAISSGGANYTSALYLATIQAPGKEDLKLFAKVAAVGEKIRAIEPHKIYETESLFYNYLLKKYKELEERNNIPAEYRFVTPKYYGGSDEYLKETFIFEDLTARGFTTHDRFKSIDWEYASKAIENLARFHALSIAFSVEDPEEFKGINILKDHSDIQKYFDKTFDYYYDELCKALKRFGLDPEGLYSREDFDIEVKKVLPLGLVQATFCLLIVTVEKDEAPQMNQDIAIEDFVVNPNTLYTERLNDIVDDYIKMGII